MRGEKFEQHSGQRTFASCGGFDCRRQVTDRHRFLRSMNAVMPWGALMELVEPYYPKDEGPGRPAKPLLWMLKLYFLQIWWNLSDRQTEQAMHDSHAVAEFLGLDLGRDTPPDETTICRFRHLLERHQLGPKILRVVNEHLAAAGIRVKQGTIVDATVIEASTSCKNQQGSPDPEMGATKKGNRYYYGMKVHVGVDSQTKVIHSLEVTPANVHDSQVVGQLLHGQEEEVYGDKAYVGQEATLQQKAPKARSCILHRASRGRPLSAWQQRWNRLQNAVRAKVEHVFGTLKHRFGWRKVRFRGLAKNAQYAYAAAACVNIYHHRKTLLEYLWGSSGSPPAAFAFA